MSRSFSSFNTPENIRLEDYWRRHWSESSRATYPNPLPAHYQKIEIKKEEENETGSERENL